MNKQPLLFAPAAYWAATPEIKATVMNGCGPGGWKVDLIPDSLLFLSIHEPCDIHDWMYVCGATIADKDEADRVFLNNCLRLIKAAGGWWPLQMMRRNRAKAYYLAVKYFGGPAFWSGKNPPETLAAATAHGLSPDKGSGEGLASQAGFTRLPVLLLLVGLLMLSGCATTVGRIDTALQVVEDTTDIAIALCKEGALPTKSCAAIAAGDLAVDVIEQLIDPHVEWVE